jgi:predicted cobalt transporter CbtA
MKKLALVLIASSTLIFTSPLSTAFADNPAPTQSSVAHSEDDHGAPHDRINEENHGFEGAGMFLVGGAVVIAVGLAFFIGRRSNKSK